MDNIFADANRKLNIINVVQRYSNGQLNRSNQCCCPFHNEDAPSFTVYPNTNTFKCFGAGCGVSGDCVGFVAKLKNLSQLDAVKVLNADFGLNLNIAENNEIKSKKPDIKAYLEQCKKDVGKTDYFGKRGLTAETIKRFNLGYDEKKKQVVIPYNRKLSYYQTRSIIGKKFYKPKSEDVGGEPLYNEEVLSERDNRESIFIVESPICAMSLMQFGAKAIATCGSSGVNKIVAKLKTIKSKPKFIISLDNDPPGITAAKELSVILFKEEISHITYFVSGKEKDPNELLMKSAAALKENIQLARKEFFKQHSPYGELTSLTEIMGTKYPPKNWIIKELMSDGLYMLVAPPKAGKSFLALDMCLSVASGERFLGFDTVKQGVWYMEMEDTKPAIQERCRKVWKGKSIPHNLTFSFSDNYRIMEKDTPLKNDDTDALQSLTAYMDNTLYVDPNIKFIVVDTFQLVRGQEKKSENIYKYDYRELRVLKKFADEKGICIMLVHHTRKGKDEGNEFNEVSGSTAMTGDVDGTFKITKRKAADNDATFSVQARGVYIEPIAIRFDRETCRWVKIGNEQELLAQKAKEDYEKNDYRKIIVGLLNNNDGSWQGTITKLMEASSKYLGYCPADNTPTQVSREINRFSPMLLQYDSIIHTAPNKHGGKAGRLHWFYYKNHKKEQQVLSI